MWNLNFFLKMPYVAQVALYNKQARQNASLLARQSDRLDLVWRRLGDRSLSAGSFASVSAGPDWSNIERRESLPIARDAPLWWSDRHRSETGSMNPPYKRLAFRRYRKITRTNSKVKKCPLESFTILKILQTFQQIIKSSHLCSFGSMSITRARSNWPRWR